MILCCFFFHQPTVLNYGIHSWFLSSTNFWQSQNQPFHGCSVISALAQVSSLRNLIPGNCRTPSLKLLVSDNSKLFPLFPQLQGSSYFLKSLFLYYTSVPPLLLFESSNTYLKFSFYYILSFKELVSVFLTRPWLTQGSQFKININT